MGATEALKIFVLPNGVQPANPTTGAPAALQLSIAIAPELYAGNTNTLADFPDFVDWPTTLARQDLAFSITISHGDFEGIAPQTFTPPPVRIDTSQLVTAGLWSAFFSSSTPYISPTVPTSSQTFGSNARGHDASSDMGMLPFVGYPSSAIADFINQVNATVPSTGAPTFEQLNSVYSQILPGLVGTVAQDTRAELVRERTTPNATGTIPYYNDLTNITAAQAFALHQEYFGRIPIPISPIKIPIPTGFAESAFSPNPGQEFHSALAFIGQYRALQRALGLAFDLSIPLTALGGTLPSQIQYGNSGPGGTAFPVVWHAQAQLVVVSEGGVQLGLFAPAPVTPSSQDPNPQPITPVQVPCTTACYLAQNTFEPEYSVIGALAGNPGANDAGTSGPDTGAIGSGVLALGSSTNSSFAVHLTDMRHAAGQSAAFAVAVNKYTSPTPSTDQVVSSTVIVPPAVIPGIPSLNSSGLYLTVGTAAQYAATQAAHARALQIWFNPLDPENPNNQGELQGATVLAAADLVRGLVLDIYDATTSQWYSTNARVVTFAPGPNASFASFQSSEEGGVAQGPSLAVDSGGNPTYYVSDTLISYTGWSNAVKLPGNPVADTDALATGYSPFADSVLVTSALDPNFPLPRLRFGRTYMMGVRTVDLANNVVPLDSALNIYSTGVNTGPIPFARLDPIPSPDVYITPDYPAGLVDTLTQLVIRDIDSPPASGAPVSSRVLAPPRCTPIFAERHGMFDTVVPANTTLNTTYPNGALDTSSTAFEVISSRADKHYITPVQPGGTVPDDPMPTGCYEFLGVPYLPDPCARGGVLRIDPMNCIDSVFSGINNGSLSFPFDYNPDFNIDPWPERLPFRLSLYRADDAAGMGRSAGVVNDSDQREAQYVLEPADVLVLNLCSVPSTQDVYPNHYLLGLQFGTPAPDAVTISGTPDPNDVVAGACPAITPYSSIRLLYTVKAPLVEPVLHSLNYPPRAYGDTGISVKGGIQWGPNSTSKVDVLAAWSDPVDDPTQTDSNGNPLPPSPTTATLTPPTNDPATTNGVLAFTGPASLTAAKAGPSAQTMVTGFGSAGTEQREALDPFSGRHEFYDTHYRRVTYSGVATTRFMEFYPDIIGTPSHPKTPVNGAPANPNEYDATQFQKATLASDVATIDVLSSARPASLSIPFVVPIYTWNTSSSNNPLTSTRSASALRVFIERPWWSSGATEVLGVLTSQSAESSNVAARTADATETVDKIINATPAQAERRDAEHREHQERARERDVHEERRRHAGERAHTASGGRQPHAASPSALPDPEALYVSDWGADPVFAGGALPSPHPQMESFPNRVATAGPFTVSEDATVSVNVAAHEVQFDATRNLWYADIAIDTGSAYTPMVRLALARCQINSIQNAELGRVTLIDVHTLDPERTATVAKNSDGSYTVGLSGFSYSQASNFGKGATLLDGTKEYPVVPGITQALVQVRDNSVADGALGWDSPGAAVTLTATMGSTTDVSWTGKVKLPKGASPQNCRLLLIQYEVLPADARPVDLDTSGPETCDTTLPAPTGLYGAGYRIAHQDILQLF